MEDFFENNFYQDDIGIQDVPTDNGGQQDELDKGIYDPSQYIDKPDSIATEPPVEEGSINEEIAESTEEDIFTRPEKFETQEAELNFYKERFEHLESVIQAKPEVFDEFVQSNIQAKLEEKSQLIEGFADVYQALQTDPRAFFVKYIPEVLVEYGLNPTLSNEEIMQRVEKDLANEMGQDYKSYWDPEELLNPMSMSSKIFARQQQMMGEYRAQNSKNQELTNNWAKLINEGKIKQASIEGEGRDAQIQQTIEQEYESNFSKHMSRPEYDAFLEVAKSHTMTMDDVHKVVHFEDYMKAAFEKGKKDGAGNNYEAALRRGGEEVVLNDARSVNGSQVPVRRDPYQVSSNSDIYSAIMNGGIPQY